MEQDTSPKEALPENCRARHVYADLYQCLVTPPRCKHAIPYGGSFFCFQPGKNNISRSTTD